MLLPVLVMAELVARHAVDVRFLDDWMMAETLIQQAEGTLSFKSLMAVQMEHRLFVPKLVTLAVHRVFGADMRGEVAVTCLLVLGTYANLIWLLRRVSGFARLSEWWLPAALMGLCMLSPVQWQTLLWPVCFTSVIPAFCLTGALVCWFSRRPRWLAFAGAALLSAAATYSFATGVLCWFWVLAVILLEPGRPVRQRLGWGAGWLGALAGCLAFYFADFDNTVASHYAYGGGKEGTFARAAAAFMAAPLNTAQFVLAFLGGHLCRGLHVDNTTAAIVLGLGSVVGCLLAAGFVFSLWKREPNAVRAALPWLVLAGHAAATGVMIALGRMWVTSSLVQAITVRYAAYSIWITVGLIGLWWVVAHSGCWQKENRSPLALAWREGLKPAAAALCVFLLIGWRYGASMMEEWHGARLQGAARLLFLDLIPQTQYLGALGIDSREVARVARRLDSHGLLSPRPLRGLDLAAGFSISSSKVLPQSAFFRGIKWDPATEELLVDGFAKLPGSRRPADAVVLATRKQAGDPWSIAGLITIDALPRHLEQSTRRDYEFISSYRWTAAETCVWNPKVHWAKPVDAGDELSAWAIDVEKRRLYRIPAEGVPRVPAKPDDDLPPLAASVRPSAQVSEPAIQPRAGSEKASNPTRQ